MSYILHYGGKETTWTETCAIDLHKSQMINLEYMLGSSDQSIILEMNANEIKKILKLITGENDPQEIDINSLFFILVLTNQNLNNE